jgi:nucleoside-diphosphate-sugar epimerase
MSTIVLSGGRDALGRGVEALLRDSGADVVDFTTHAKSADALIHLGGDVEDTRAVLDVAGEVGTRHVVLLSSATAYGAWPNNPVPLTEDALLRPCPELDFAVRAAERERLLADFKAAHPGTTATVLRPTTIVADGAGWLARGLRAARGVHEAGSAESPSQYVHADDVAAAVALAAEQRLDGVYNVAPDGWIDGERLHALDGRPRLSLPRALTSRVTRWRWKLGLSPAPPGLLPYTRHPWVVANDRIKAAGWTPTQTNEEAFVAGHRAPPWVGLSPQRKQELILGGSAIAIVAAVLAAVFGARWFLRRHTD